MAGGLLVSVGPCETADHRPSPAGVGGMAILARYCFVHYDSRGPRWIVFRQTRLLDYRLSAFHGGVLSPGERVLTLSVGYAELAWTGDCAPGERYRNCGACIARDSECWISPTGPFHLQGAQRPPSRINDAVAPGKFECTVC